jgi:hypothetical protein
VSYLEPEPTPTDTPTSTPTETPTETPTPTPTPTHTPTPAVLDCLGIGGTLDGEDCTLDAFFFCLGPTTIEIAGSLTLTSDAFISCDGWPGSSGQCGQDGKDLAITVGGDLTIDEGAWIPARSAETAAMQATAGTAARSSWKLAA